MNSNFASLWHSVAETNGAIGTLPHAGVRIQLPEKCLDGFNATLLTVGLSMPMAGLQP
jgi:hypothetical protein